MSVFEVSGPEWLTEEPIDWRSCETCGHWSSFSAGFEYNQEGYVQGWYEDEISCFGGARYSWWIGDMFREYLNPECEEGTCDEDCLCDLAEEPEDSVTRFRQFLTETDTDEAQQILDELERLGL